MIGLQHYLVVSAILFTMGVLGIFINRKNIIIILMAIELILLAVNINLVAFSAFLGDLVGQVFAMFVLTVAAGEAAGRDPDRDPEIGPERQIGRAPEEPTDDDRARRLDVRGCTVCRL